MQGGGQNLEQSNVELPIFQNFENYQNLQIRKFYIYENLKFLNSKILHFRKSKKFQSRHFGKSKNLESRKFLISEDRNFDIFESIKRIERPIYYRNFEISNIERTKDKLFDFFIFAFICYFYDF